MSPQPETTQHQARGSTCRNCGRPTGPGFCGHCGQPLDDRRRPLLLAFIYSQLMGFGLGLAVSAAIWRA